MLSRVLNLSSRRTPRGPPPHHWPATYSYSWWRSTVGVRSLHNITDSRSHLHWLSKTRACDRVIFWFFWITAVTPKHRSVYAFHVINNLHWIRDCNSSMVIVLLLWNTSVSTYRKLMIVQIPNSPTVSKISNCWLHTEFFHKLADISSSSLLPLGSLYRRTRNLINCIYPCIKSWS